MNVLKNILFFGLLLAALSFVYLSLNRSPEHPMPDFSGDTKPPTIEMGNLVPPLANVSSGSESSGPPPFSSRPQMTETPPAGLTGSAPPFKSAAEVQTPAQPWPSGDTAALPPPPPSPPDAGQGANLRQGAAPPFERNFSALNDLGSSAASTAAANHSATNLDLVMEQVKLQVGESKYSDALFNLTQLYGNSDLPPAQARRVTEILDQLAAKVIYSREHWLGEPYRVQPSETLDIIADHYRVPALLLARINGIRDPQNVPPGKELKVLKGPFSAQVSTDRSEMTLMLAGRYAGRFSVVLSSDLSGAGSMWTVRERSPQASTLGGRENKQWMELVNASGQICSIQGTNDTRVASGSDSHNKIWLSEQDMDDVFGILSVGSRVIIQR